MDLSVPALLLSSLVQSAPSLEFAGFRPGMPVAEATTLIASAGGALRCRPTTDSRLRECTGSLPRAGIAAPLRVLISCVHDSAAVIVLSGTPAPELARAWIEDLTLGLGRPLYRAEPATQHMWQWVKRGRMLRVVVRTDGDTLATSVTLTHGPLLDGLGDPEIRKPD